MNPRDPIDIVRSVKVNRGRTPKEMIDATDRKQFINYDALAAMPGGHKSGSKGEEIEVYFFKFFNTNRLFNAKEIKEEYEARGLEPDPYAVAQVNIDDPTFADACPNAAQWNIRDGEFGYAMFYPWGEDRRVCVDCFDHVSLPGPWWFGGVYKRS